MIKFSKNQKYNKLVNSIYEELMEFGADEVKRYYDEFKNGDGNERCIDYNIVQWGNLTIYYDDVRKIWTDAGYKTSNYSDAKLWYSYKSIVGWLAYRIANKINFEEV